MIKYYKDSYESHKAKTRSLFRLNLKVIFIIAVPLLAILLTSFAFHFYRVSGPSMEETLGDSDILIVDKSKRVFSNVVGDYKPNRYDIVVFKQPTFDENTEIVKRVIGLPGDRIVIKDGEVRLYNKKNKDGSIIKPSLDTYAKINGTTDGNIDTRIKDGEVFVLGDNRPDSVDSRYFGSVRTENIIGEVRVRIYPLNNLWMFF